MKTVLVTGAARGIGRATAEAFSKAGYNVVINYYKSKTEALSLAKSLKNAVAIEANICDCGEIEIMFNTARAIFGGIDVLVNNAGIALQKQINDTTTEDYDSVFNTNMRGAFFCTQAALPYMINKKSGAIINISSMWAKTGASCEVIYSASKAALEGFTKALAKELGPSGIRVNSVAPGYIDTDMNKNIPPEIAKSFADETPLSRLGTPVDVAKAVLFLADENSFITGQIIGVDGGLV
ncbi:MAG: 3-oxoacyl-ACP reductase [Clostridiales bacterium]|nr:MAG: 3-oxoacyl-ACP reductase [Clostridiales bacterium]